MKIYTRSGDPGETGLVGGARVAKDAERIEAYGTVDELNALLGVVRAEGLPGRLDRIVVRLQHELFEVGAELASCDPITSGTRTITTEHVRMMEDDIDRLEATLPPLTTFVLPGGTRSAANLHLARAVCRRAERRLVTLLRVSKNETTLSSYLNRLGDLIFLLARAANASAKEVETPWGKTGE